MLQYLADGSIFPDTRRELWTSPSPAQLGNHYGTGVLVQYKHLSLPYGNVMEDDVKDAPDLSTEGSSTQSDERRRVCKTQERKCATMKPSISV